MSEHAIPLEDDPRLTAYAIGEMDAGDIAEFEELLAASPGAQAEVEAIRSISEALGSEFSAELASVESRGPAIAVAVDRPAVAKNVLRPPTWLFGAVAAGMAAMLTVTTLVHFKSNQPAVTGTVVDRGEPVSDLALVDELGMERLEKDAGRSDALLAEGAMPALAAESESRDFDSTAFEAELSKKAQSLSLPAPTSSPAPADVTVDEALVETNAMFGRKAKRADGEQDRFKSGVDTPALIAAPAPAPAPTAVAGVGRDAGADSRRGAGSPTVERAAAGEAAGSIQPAPAPVGLSVQPARAPGQVAVPSTAVMEGKAAVNFEYKADSNALRSRQPDEEQATENWRSYVAIPENAAETAPASLFYAGGGGGGNRHAPLIDNVFKDPLDEELSTFSIDVDTASYALLRRSLLNDQRWPHRDQVRIEELINYFDYDYPAPDLEQVEAGQVAPFAVSIDDGVAPWAPKHRLVRIGLKSAELKGDRPAANLVFLVDVSGSMSSPDKLGLVQKSLRELVPQLDAEDRVTLVAYAGRAGEVLAPTAGDRHETILAAIDALSAGGSTNGAGGIKVAYQRARQHFIEDGVNRVILATDGDFNVGVSGDDELVQLVETQAGSGVFLTVLGFGSGNLNDAMMEKITNKGNGNYFYIDRYEEGKKVLVEQMAGTLVTVAKDVKIQVDFNPAKVASYRLIGYANRMLNREDFDNDKIDAGEIGAGHTVTALYEVVPVGVAQELTGAQQLEGLKYQRRLDAAAEQDLEAKRQKQLADRGVELVESRELLTVKLRYKRPAQDESALLEFPLEDRADGLDREAGDDFRFASAVAAFGMRLRQSRYIDQQFSLEAIAEIAAGAKGEDPSGRRAEFVEIVKSAAAIEPGAKEDVRRAVQERLKELR